MKELRLSLPSTFLPNLPTKRPTFFAKNKKIYLKKSHVQQCTWSTISLQSMQTESREPSSLSLSPARGDTMLHLLLVLKHHPVIWLDKTGKREPSSLSLSPARGDTMLHLLLVLKHHPVIWLVKTGKREPSSLSLSPARGETMLHLLLVLKHHPVIWLDKTGKRETFQPARGDTMLHLLLVLKHHPVIWLVKTRKREPSILSLLAELDDNRPHLLVAESSFTIKIGWHENYVDGAL